MKRSNFVRNCALHKPDWQCRQGALKILGSFQMSNKRTKSFDNMLYFAVALSFLGVAMMTDQYGESLNDVIARKTPPSRVALLSE